MTSQRCPRCGVVEAAGACCTACLAPTGERDHRVDPARARRPRRGATERPATPASGPGVHPRPQRAAMAVPAAARAAADGLWSEAELRAAWGNR